MPEQFDIEEVLSQLTVQEKAGLLAGIDIWHTYPVERLNLPSLRFSDGPNGVRGTRFFNSIPGAVLPNGTALAATFDKELLKEAGVLIGVEAKHKSTHVNLGPTANIQRGPNGGRGFESFSEDPYLSGIAASELIKGIQSQNIAATIKHFVGNDLEDERRASDSIITQRALREIYLEPFRLVIKNSDPKALMTSYNKVNGEHVSHSKYLLKDILKDEWKYTGTIMSDWFGTYTNKASIQNGLDIEMPGPPLLRTEEAIVHQIASKEINLNDLDDRVRGVLKLIQYAQASGIPENGPEDTDNNTPETSKLLRKVAAESIVLLKNEDNVLPLKKEETVAVIGPNAKFAAYSGGGSAALSAYYTVTPYQGIVNKIGSNPSYTIGAEGFLNLPDLGEHLKNPKTGDKGYHIVFHHEPHGESTKTIFEELDMIESYHNFLDFYHPEAKPIFYADFEGIFVPEETSEYEFGIAVYGIAQLFIDDTLVVDNKTKQTLGTFFNNEGTVEERGKIKLEGGKEYKVRIEFGSSKTYTLRASPDEVDLTRYGGIKFGFRKVIDAFKEIEAAATLAKSVDKVILSIGLNAEWETEGDDRKNLRLPGYTDDLVKAVLAANPNTVVVNQSGTPVEFPWLKNAKALVHAWFGGNELGNAIADVLYGDVNPSGKLSLSFPLRFEDNPAFLNFKTERGRVLYGEDIFVGYRYYEKLQRQVAFPFGYGLSYTTFAFSKLNVSIDESSDTLEVLVTVKNTGERAGKEVVQVYIAKSDSDVIRPVKELKGFEKISLAAGEQKAVSIKLVLKDSISFFDEYQDKWSAQAGEYQVHVGTSSDDISLIETFSTSKSLLWTGL